jgi:hypothetical protein
MFWHVHPTVVMWKHVKTCEKNPLPQKFGTMEGKSHVWRSALACQDRNSKRRLMKEIKQFAQTCLTGTRQHHRYSQSF